MAKAMGGEEGRGSGVVRLPAWILLGQHLKLWTAKVRDIMSLPAFFWGQLLTPILMSEALPIHQPHTFNRGNLRRKCIYTPGDLGPRE